MDNQSISSNDLNTLKRLVVITRSILSNYYCLIDLEKDGDIESEEFKKIVNELIINFEMEEELYNKIENIISLSEYFLYITNYEQGVFENYLFMIFDQNSDKLIQSRITSKLEYLMDTNMFLEDNIDEEEDLEDDHIVDKELVALNKIQISIENDIISTVLNLLNNYINNPNYINIKQALIEYKYMLIYLFNDIEKEMINNNYKLDNNLNWSHMFVADYYGIKEGFIKEQEGEYSIDLLTESRELLVSLLDSNIEKIDNIEESEYFIDATIFSIIARSCLLFTNKDLVNSFINILKNDIKDIENKNESVIPIINSIIDSYEKDIELPAILRLKK